MTKRADVLRGYKPLTDEDRRWAIGVCLRHYANDYVSRCILAGWKDGRAAAITSAKKVLGNDWGAYLGDGDADGMAARGGLGACLVTRGRRRGFLTWGELVDAVAPVRQEVLF